MGCYEISSGHKDGVPYALKQQVLKKLDDLVLAANKLFNRSFTPPKVKFYLKGTTAGKADLLNNIVILNHILLVENPDDFLEDTVPHELAHLLTFAMFGRKAKAHGKEWKSVMRALGVEPTRCHSLDVSNVGNRHSYRCACKSHQLSTQRHNKIRRGASYICKSCGHVLVLESSGKQPFKPSAIPPSPKPVSKPSYSKPTVISRPSPAARAPSDAMLKYAKDLAAKHKIMLTPEIVRDFETCRQFISMWAKVR